MGDKESGYKEKGAAELSIVIPCFNSFQTLPELNERLKKVLEELRVDYEIIYVNDASKDQTGLLLRDYALGDQHVVTIDLMFNVGQFRAVMCGLEHARGSYVITMDDDLQHPPEEIPRFYHELKNNSELDAVIGSYKKRKHSFIRYTGSLLARKIRGSVFNKPKDFQITSFRCLNRPLVDAVVSHRTMFPAISLLIFRSSARISSIEVEHNERKHGTSNYSLAKLIKTFVNHTFSYTSLPLKYISFLGISIAAVGFALALYYLIRYYLGQITIPGWTTVIILINIYSGLLLLSVGIIGEYLLKTLQ
ncbi:MAG: glycosyltransferase family 2 protein, partial [Bacillota bacterium]